MMRRKSKILLSWLHRTFKSAVLREPVFIQIHQYCCGKLLSFRMFLDTSCFELQLKRVWILWSAKFIY